MTGFRILDYFFLIVFLGVVIASVFWSSAGRGGDLRVEIEASGVLHVMPLSTDGTLVLDGPVGETWVEVADGAVSVTHSDCRDKICIAMGSVSKPSGWLACLPNRVFIRVVAVGGSSADDEVNGGAVDAGSF